MLTSSRRTNIFCTLWLLLLASVSAAAQVNQTGRFEIVMDPFTTSDSYTVVSAKKDGLAVLSDVVIDNKNYLQVIRLDTTLAETWRGYIEVEKNYVPRQAIVHNKLLLVLCKNLSPSKASLKLIELNLETKNYRTFTILNFIPFTPTEFIAAGNSVLVAGYFNYRPFVLHFNMDTDKSKILPGFFNEQGELVQLKATDEGLVDVIVNSKNVEGKKCLFIRNYDSEGTLIKTTILAPDADKNFIFGRSVQTPDDEQVVAGVYGRTALYSRGIFVARIDPEGAYNTNYYNFADLQNFFKYMKGKREKRVRERIERRKVQGKKIRFNYKFLVHQLIPYGDQYIMLGEAFYPVYKNLQPGATTVFASTGYARSSRSDYVFDGYKYTHAIVIGFSKTGKLLWDNSFEINDVKSFKLEQFVKIQPQKNQISLFYLFGDDIRSKIIKGSEVIEGKTMEPLKTKWSQDRIIKEPNQSNKLEYWYPGHFYAFGGQQLVNTTQIGPAVNRKVFFINKIEIH